ncbi:MFS transporter [Candidatus Daviesbacteria bacterium]|nr:MFS transporter [Candidatus Daviesbacteria bacterium]
MERISKKQPLFFLYLTIFVNIIGFGMVFPLLPFYAKEFQASEAVIGFLAASFAIGEFLFAPLWGRLSDRFGRKPIILISLLGISVAFASFAIANTLTWLFISRFLQGVFSSAAFTAASAYVVDMTTREERISGMSRLGASLATGFIFGPAIGGVLSSVSHQLPFFAAAAITIFNLISVQLFLKESLKEKEEKLILKEGFLNIKAMYKGLRGPLGGLFILIFIWSYALSNNQVAVPLFGTEILKASAVLIGIFFSLQGLTSGSVQWFLLGKIASRVGEHKIIFLGLSFMMVSLFILPFSQAAFMMAILMIVFSFGSAITRPTLQTLISKYTHEGQGTTMGIASAFEASGRIIGPILGGSFYLRFGFHSPFTISALLILITLIFVAQIRGIFKD